MDNDRIRLLQQMPIFGGISHDTLGYLQDQAHIVSVPQGEFFFDEGELADAVYVLDKGQAFVYKSWRGDNYRLNSLHVGDCFGEMAIIEMSRRSAAVKAVENCEAIRLSISICLCHTQFHLQHFPFLISREMPAIRTNSFNPAWDCIT